MIIMYTQCPECKHVLTTSVDELRDTRAIKYCPQCAIYFDSLELLSESSPLSEQTENQKDKSAHVEQTFAKLQYVSDIEDNEEPLPWEKAQEHKRSSVLWAYGFFAAVLLLFAQIFWFEQQKLYNSQQLRPYLIPICRLLTCQLPIFSDLSLIEITHSHLQKNRAGKYHLQVVISNHAAFQQAYPKLHLALQGYSGETVAERTFYSREFLVLTSEESLFQANASIQAVLRFVEPEQAIAGFTVALIADR